MWKGIYLVFRNKNKPEIWDGETFGDLNSGIGAPLGYVVEDLLKQQKALNQNSYTSLEALKLVAHNRLDGYVIDKEIGEYFIEQYQLEESITISPQPYYSDYWHLAFSKGFYQAFPHKADAFWQAISQNSTP